MSFLRLLKSRWWSTKKPSLLNHHTNFLTRTDIYLSLLDWRNTPSEGMSSSPAQRMFGRRTRTLLPTTSYLLKPKVQEDVKEKLLKQKSKQAKYYNQNTKELPPLQTGEVVRVAPKPDDREQKWFKARV